MKVLIFCTLTFQAILLGILAYGRKFFLFVLLFILLNLPQQAVAGCHWYTVMLPDGRVMNCQNCDGYVICS